MKFSKLPQYCPQIKFNCGGLSLFQMWMRQYSSRGVRMMSRPWRKVDGELSHFFPSQMAIASDVTWRYVSQPHSTIRSLPSFVHRLLLGSLIFVIFLAASYIQVGTSSIWYWMIDWSAKSSSNSSKPGRHFSCIITTWSQILFLSE